MNKCAIITIICLSFLAGCTNFEKTAEKTATLVSFSETSQPRDKDQIKKSIVKITSKNNQGTGFIVGLMSNTAYILTVSHVVASDPVPNVEFFGQTREFKARVLEIEGQQENGFALLAVTGAPSDAIPLYVDKKSDLEQGDSVFTFGFPQTGVDWAYDELRYSGSRARAILFSKSSIEEGNSGSPLIKANKVVGIVTSVTNFAHANSAESIMEFLRGAKGGNIVLEHMEKWQKVTIPKPETSDMPATHSEEAPKKPSNGLIMAIPSPIDNKAQALRKESAEQLEARNRQQLALAEQQHVAAEKAATAKEAENKQKQLLAEQQRIAAEKAAKEAEDRRKQQLAEQQRIAAEKAENKQKQQLAEQQHASVWQSTNNNTKYKVSVTPSMTPGCKSTITEVYGDGQKRELIPTYLCKQPDGTWKEEQIENATTDTPSDNYQQSAKGGESLLSRMDGEQREIIPKQDITENSAASSGESEFDKLVSEIMKKMGINTERAEKFIFMVQDTAQKLQENLTRIASHETSKAEKQKLVRATIDEFFVDGFKSTVQTVMLKNQPTITNVAAATYLNELLKLSDHYVVELLFDKEYLHLSTGTIKRLEDNNKISYIFNVKMWQMVKICKDHGAFCDTNYTQQGVNFIFKQESSSWKLRVKYITTTKPIPFREGRYGKLEH